MTKKEIVKQISDDMGLTQLKVKEIVQRTFESIIDTLVEDPRHRIELRNFGVFEVKKRAARKARNPRTGERVDVAEKYVVTFKPGKEMEERVLQLEEQERAETSQAESSPAATEQHETPSTPESGLAPQQPSPSAPESPTPDSSERPMSPPPSVSEPSRFGESHSPSHH